MGPSPHLWFCAFTTATLWAEFLVSMCPRTHLSFSACKTMWLASRMTLVYWSQPSSVVLCIQNSDFSFRITSLYGSQTSPVVLSMQNNMINIRNTSVYGSQPSSVNFACKTATFGPELQVSMDPSPHLCFLHAKQRLLDQNYKSLMGPRLRLLICECKTTCLDPEWRLSVGPNLHLWFCAFKTADFSIRIC